MSNATTLKQDLADVLAQLTPERNELTVTIQETKGLNFSKLPSHNALTLLEVTIPPKRIVVCTRKKSDTI